MEHVRRMTGPDDLDGEMAIMEMDMEKKLKSTLNIDLEGRPLLKNIFNINIFNL